MLVRTVIGAKPTRCGHPLEEGGPTWHESVRKWKIWRRERWEKSNLHSLLFLGFARVTLRRTALPSGIFDQKVGPFLATWPKVGPFLATALVETIVKYNCLSCVRVAFELRSCCLFLTALPEIILQGRGRTQNKSECIMLQKLNIVGYKGKRG